MSDSGLSPPHARQHHREHATLRFHHISYAEGRFLFAPRSPFRHVGSVEFAFAFAGMDAVILGAGKPPVAITDFTIVRHSQHLR